MLNLGHWRLLVATADTANISRAAERVGITQSGASQAIAQLEASLGLQVFTRSRKEVAVTALANRSSITPARCCLTWSPSARLPTTARD